MAARVSGLIPKKERAEVQAANMASLSGAIELIKEGVIPTLADYTEPKALLDALYPGKPNRVKHILSGAVRLTQKALADKIAGTMTVRLDKIKDRTRREAIKQANERIINDLAGEFGTTDTKVMEAIIASGLPNQKQVLSNLAEIDVEAVRAKLAEIQASA